MFEITTFSARKKPIRVMKGATNMLNTKQRLTSQDLLKVFKANLTNSKANLAGNFYKIKYFFLN